MVDGRQIEHGNFKIGDVKGADMQVVQDEGGGYHGIGTQPGG